MADKKTESITDSQAIAKLLTAVANLSADVQSLKQASQQGAQQVGQQSGAAQLLGELANQVATSSSRDTDVNAEEAMKSYSPMWGLNGKLIFATEMANFATAQNQATQILQNAINTANTVQTDAAATLGNRLILGFKATANAVGQPAYFHENAPAAQDTPGEGADERPSKK